MMEDIDSRIYLPSISITDYVCKKTRKSQHIYADDVKSMNTEAQKITIVQRKHPRNDTSTKTLFVTKVQPKKITATRLALFGLYQ